MTDEEMAALQEELAEARAEVERLSLAAADSQARAAHLEETVGQLRAALAQAQEEIRTWEQEAESLRQTVAQGAAQYRELVLAQAPEVPAEMVSGETVAEVEESLAKARQMVARVREQLESQARAQRVPAGAPPRQGPDLSALSALEKIKLGLQEQSSRR